MEELHSRYCGGHYATCATTHKILRAGYYWPMLFLDVHRFIMTCQEYRFSTGRQHLLALPLQPIVVEVPFQQWGVDFISEFKGNSSNGFRWILTATMYFTRWVEVIPTKGQLK
jgi:hypothetical protein